MKLHFAISLMALATACFSAPRTTSAADKVDVSYGTALTKVLPQRYFDVKRKTNIMGHFISNVAKAGSPRSLDLQTSSRQGGLTGDKCSSSSECREDRTCQDVGALGLRCFFRDGGSKLCQKSSDCSPGELCYRLQTSGGPSQECGSTSFAAEINAIAKERDPNAPLPFIPVADGSGNDPCIGAHLLAHLSRNKLVFEKDILSNVLCDEHNSCATPGHMVTYHGKGMMMKSYCEMIGGCVKKVMFVNSLRYSVKATVPSLSENMVFTAFSARYVTRAEEGMLSMAIRMGF